MRRERGGSDHGGEHRGHDGGRRYLRQVPTPTSWVPRGAVEGAEVGVEITHITLDGRREPVITCVVTVREGKPSRREDSDEHV
jgi:hypothetical protein